MKELKLKRCRKCNALVKVLEDCNCKGCGIICCDEAMEEVRFHLEKTDDPKNVVIVGAGPAGLEAARVAALEGHHVSIYDKGSRLGGTMRTIATAKFKTKIKELADYFEYQLDKLGVDVHLNTTVTGEEEFLEKADVIFVGTGTVPVTPNIPGIDNSGG